jgi:hypothetical protein
MPATEIVNLDDYEQKKLTILTFEKYQAFATCFGFVLVVLVCALVLSKDAYDLYVILTDQSPNAAGGIRGDLFGLVGLLLCLVAVYARLYFSRAVEQVRPRSTRAIQIAAFAVLVAFAYAIYVIPDAWQDFVQAIVVAWNLYTAHWASILEVIAILALCCAQGGFGIIGPLRSMRTWRRLTERDKLFVREDSEKGFYRGRVLRTALSIPRITDLMPRRRFITTVEFVLANFFVTLSMFWIIVYAGFFAYRCLIVVAYYDDDVANPYVQATAVSHMLYSISISLLVFFVSPIIGGYLLTVAQFNVHWSITRLLEADGRAPILFLRAFKDDQVQLQNVKLSLLGRLGRWLDAIGNLDGLLLQEGSTYGPVVAIGNPGDKFPPYGAARGYFDDKTWRVAVADLAGNALAIVICLDRTEGVWWEVEHIARLGYLSKTLFLIHPKDSSEPENRALASDITNLLRPDTGTPAASPEHEIEAAGDARNDALLGFFFDEQGVMHAGRSTTFSRLAFLIQVRWFLRSKFGFAAVAA